MSQDWNLVPLSQIISERQEVPFVDALIKGEICIIEKIGFNDGKIQLRSNTTTKTNMILIQPGDLVVSGINAAKGAIAVFDENNTVPIAATIHYSSYIINKQKADIRYLWWLLRSHKFKELLLEYVPGGIKTELKAKRLLPIPIPLPLLEEQRRIVGRVEEIVGKIEEVRSLRQQVIKETEALRVSSAKAIFNELVQADTQPLRELVTVQGGGTPSKQNPFFWEGSIPWISPKDMKSLELTDSIDHISEQAILKSSARLLEPGSILIVVRGMILAHTVPSAILRVPATINQDMKALFPSEKITPEYLCCVLWTLNDLILELVEKSTHDTRKLETAKLLNFKIPVPPLPEQRRIVAYLDELQTKVDTIKRLREQAIKELDGLLPSILDKAFKGEL